MIDEADRDGDGEVNEEELLRVMKKTNLFWLTPSILELYLALLPQHGVLYSIDEIKLAVLQASARARPDSMSS